MRTTAPQTALEAVACRRLLISSWPWRSAAYVLVSLPVAALATAGLAIPAIPWLMLAAGGYQVGVIVLLILLGGVLIAALGPLIAIPVAAAGRWRLRLVDRRPSNPGRAGTAAAARSGSWLRARYADPAAWHETAYVCLLATVVPALCSGALLALLLSGILIVSPILVMAQQPGGGAPVELAVGQASTMAQAVPYMIAGIAMLPLVPYLMTLIAGADAAVGRALLSGGSTERLRAELTEVSRSRARLADAFEAERRRIERDLHDGAQQKLVSLTMQLGLARLDLPPGSPGADTVAAAHDQAKQLMAELRELIHGIQPQVLTDLGLPAALDELADQSPIPVTVAAHLNGRLPGHIENTAYFVTAEALTNIAKHSGATHATVTARQDDAMLIIEVTDNGRGGADPGRGTGLTGLADRVAVADGRMLVSSPPGGPTILRVEVSCPQSTPSSG